jgi:magnesium-transporting ATPase (P-type)
MATLRRAPDGGAVLFVKGAPESLLALSPGADAAYWHERIAQAASAGERVLGFATRKVDTLDVRELQFLGIAGFIDPPRAEALAALEECRGAGIAVRMITGDHAATAAAIARQLGLPADAVHARATPEDKLRLVRELQARGAVVAMTGDGVNDAPALKQADVGVAMGIKGTEASKEAAGMVLLDDNFASIVAAVREGRTVHDNIRKVVAWTLPTNGGEALTVIAAMLFGLVLPMSAVQILWVNLVADVALGLALAFEPAEPDVMRRAPRSRDAPLLSRFLLWRVVLVSVLFAAISLGVFFGAQALGRELETARTLVVNTLVVLQVFYLFNVRYLHAAAFTWRGALGTPALLWALAAVVAAQLAFTYAPFMQRWFDTRPVALLDGVLVLACGVAFMLALEAEKRLLR